VGGVGEVGGVGGAVSAGWGAGDGAWAGAWAGGALSVSMLFNSASKPEANVVPGDWGAGTGGVVGVGGAAGAVAAGVEVGVDVGVGVGAVKVVDISIAVLAAFYGQSIH